MASKQKARKNTAITPTPKGPTRSTRNKNLQTMEDDIENRPVNVEATEADVESVRVEESNKRKGKKPAKRQLADEDSSGEMPQVLDEISQKKLKKPDVKKGGRKGKKAQQVEEDSAQEASEEGQAENDQLPTIAEEGDRVPVVILDDSSSTEEIVNKPEKPTKKKPAKKQAAKGKKAKPVEKSDEETQNEKPDETEEAVSEPKKPAKKQTRNAKKDVQSEEAVDESGDSQTAEKLAKKGKGKAKAKSSQASTSNDASDDDFEVDQPEKKKGRKQATPKTSTASSSKEEKGPKAANRSILQLKIELRDSNPLVWRRIQVLNNVTFAQLREYIDEAMGWGVPQHNYFWVHNAKTNKDVQIMDASRPTFGVENDDRGLPKQQNTKLAKYLNAKGDHVMYEYGVADTFYHDVILEKVLPPPPPKAEYPKCKGGKGSCPPYDIQGVEQFNHLVEVYKNPEHPEYQELIEDWLAEFSPGWHPDRFNQKSVYKKVKMWVYCGP